ncbi:Ubiquitin-like-specific protease 1 [Lasiodiplodia hormozganensis]|uniref:Ubiquitin-like-specific protease 1 n=1 Tax=Lasiodiplodia hormozganensis TaxID=869390 RepID=A0AA39YUS4_9PEZI|nr:Ubiquitin-like-specific protease 1 [Lasiodiplodia hormozganensis]
MEDTSDMDLDLSYDRDVRSHANNHATPAHPDNSQTDTAQDGSPMNWSPTNPTQTSIPDQGQQPLASMPTINRTLSSIHMNNSIARHASTINNSAAPHTFISSLINNNRSRQTYHPRTNFRHFKFGPSHAGAVARPPPAQEPRSYYDFKASQPATQSSGKKSLLKESLIKNQLARNTPRKDVAPITPSKRRGDDNDAIEDTESSARGFTEPLESERPSFVQNQRDGIFMTKVKDHFRAIIRSIVCADKRREIVFVPTGPLSNKRRAIFRPMPGAFPIDDPSPTDPAASNNANPAHADPADAAAATDQTTNVRSESSISFGKAFKHVGRFFTSTVSSNNGATSNTHLSSDDQTAQSSSITSPNDHSGATSSNTNTSSNSQSAQSSSMTTSAQGHITEESGSSSPSGSNDIIQTPPSLKRKRAAVADAEEEDLPMHKPKKSRKSSNVSKKSPIQMQIPGNTILKMDKRAAKEAAEAADKEKDDLPMHKPKKANGSKKAPIRFKLTGKSMKGFDSSERSGRDDDLPALKSRFGSAQPQRRHISVAAVPRIQNRNERTNIALAPSSSAVARITDQNNDSLTAPARRAQKIMDATQPDPAQNITQVQMNRESGRHTGGQADFQTYRESEERPSTSSSGSSEEGQQSQREKNESPGDTETIGADVGKASAQVAKTAADRPNNGHKQPGPVANQKAEQTLHEQVMDSRTQTAENYFAGTEWNKPIELAESSDEGSAQDVRVTQWHLRDKEVKEMINVRKPTATSLEQLMENTSFKETGDLEISDSRKDSREEELEKQRRAEAEAKRKADEAAAEAKRKAEQEEAEARKKLEREKKALEQAKSERRRQLLSQGPTDAQVAEIKSTFASRDPMSEIARNFTVRDLSTLVPHTTWLNDSLINKYLEELTKKACEKEGYTESDKKAGKAPPYQFVLSNWWVAVADKGIQKVLPWNRRSRLHEERLLQVKALFIPICHGAHWRLVVVSGTERTINYYDSLAGSPAPFVAKAHEWVKATLGSAYNDAEWSVIVGGGQRSPRQSNSDDCGVFTLQNARAVALGLDIQPNLYVTSTEGVLRVRHQMAAQLLSGGLDWE